MLEEQVPYGRVNSTKGPHRRRILPAMSPANLHQYNAKASTASSQKQKAGDFTRISFACEACKKRKAKCTGLPAPCRTCYTQGTECLFDIALDQRRKAFTHRLAENHSSQQGLLQTIVQTIRFGNSHELESLNSAIRDSLSIHEMSQVLITNADSMQRRDALQPVTLDDLLLAYSNSVNDPLGDHYEIGQMSVDQSSSAADDKDGPFGSETSSLDKNTKRPESRSARRPTVSEQLGIYERWIRLFGDQQIREYDQKLRHRKGLWRQYRGSQPPMIISQPIQASREALRENRSDWHTALQIPDDDLMPPEPPSFHVDSALQAELNDVTSLVMAQDTGTSEGWVEILSTAIDERQFADKAGSERDSYHLDFRRHLLHVVQPVHAPDDSPLSRVILDFKNAARNCITDGIASAEIIGQDGIFVDLFFHQRTELDAYNVCNWAAELSRTYDQWDIYVRLALCLCHSYLMRWMLCPTRRRYIDIPDIIKPLPIQRIVAHHAAIDFLPVACIRESLVKDLADWMTALPAAKLSVNWTEGLDAAVIHDATDGKLRLTEKFEKHVVQASNWSVGESILKTFPELSGKVRLDPGN